MITRILLAAFLCVSMPYKKEKNVNIDDLVTETQVSNGGADDISICWWVPCEFWECALAGQGIPADQLDETLEVLREYEMVGIVQGELNSFGVPDFTSKMEVEKNLKIVSSSNNSVLMPLSDAEISSEMKILMVTMSPIMESIMGELGGNFHFFVFDSENANGKRICNPLSDGTLTVHTSKFEYEYSTPLPSLVQKKVCPVDGELLNGTWHFCPHHGDKLKEQ